MKRLAIENSGSKPVDFIKLICNIINIIVIVIKIAISVIMSSKCQTYWINYFNWSLIFRWNDHVTWKYCNVLNVALHNMNLHFKINDNISMNINQYYSFIITIATISIIVMTICRPPCTNMYNCTILDIYIIVIVFIGEFVAIMATY